MALKDLITGYAPIVKDLVTQVAPIVKEKMANTPVKNQATKSNEVRTAKVLPPAPVKQQATKSEEVRTPKVLPPAPVKKHATKIEELREPKVMTGTGWSNVTNSIQKTVPAEISKLYEYTMKLAKENISNDLIKQYSGKRLTDEEAKKINKYIVPEETTIDQWDGGLKNQEDEYILDKLKDNLGHDFEKKRFEYMDENVIKPSELTIKDYQKIDPVVYEKFKKAYVNRGAIMLQKEKEDFIKYYMKKNSSKSGVFSIAPSIIKDSLIKDSFDHEKIAKKYPEQYKEAEAEYYKEKEKAYYIGKAKQELDDLFIEKEGSSAFAKKEVKKAWNVERLSQKLTEAISLGTIKPDSIIGRAFDTTYAEDGYIKYNGMMIDDEFKTEKGKTHAMITNTGAMLLGGLLPYSLISSTMKTLVNSLVLARDAGFLHKMATGIKAVEKFSPLLAETVVYNLLEEGVDAGIRTGTGQQYGFNDFVMGVLMGAGTGGALHILTGGKVLEGKGLIELAKDMEAKFKKTGNVNSLRTMQIDKEGTTLNSMFHENRYAFYNKPDSSNKNLIPGVDKSAPLPEVKKEVNIDEVNIKLNESRNINDEDLHNQDTEDMRMDIKSIEDDIQGLRKEMANETNIESKKQLETRIDEMNAYKKDIDEVIKLYEEYSPEEIKKIKDDIEKEVLSDMSYYKNIEENDDQSIHSSKKLVSDIINVFKKPRIRMLLSGGKKIADIKSGRTFKETFNNLFLQDGTADRDVFRTSLKRLAERFKDTEYSKEFADLYQSSKYGEVDESSLFDDYILPALQDYNEKSDIRAKKKRVPTKLPEYNIVDEKANATAQLLLRSKRVSDEMKTAIAEDPLSYHKVLKDEDVQDFVDGLTDEELRELLASKDAKFSTYAGAKLLEGFDDTKYTDAQADIVHQIEEIAYKAGQGVQAQKKLIEVMSPVQKLSRVEKTLPKGTILRDVDRDNIVKAFSDQKKSYKKLQAAEKQAKKTLLEKDIKKSEIAKKEFIRTAKVLRNTLNKSVPKKFFDLLTTLVQGNALVVKSFVKNPIWNAVMSPLRGYSKAQSWIADSIISLARGGGKKTITYGSPKQTAKGVAEGLVESAKISWRGALPGDMLQIDEYNIIKPIQAFISALSGKGLPVNAKTGRTRIIDRITKAIEANPTAYSAEAGFRALSWGDKPFYYSSYRNSILEQAKLLGLKGDDLKRELLFPRPDVEAKAIVAGRKTTFQEDSAVANFTTAGLNAVGNIPLIGPPFKFFARLQAIFIKTPVNVMDQTFELTVPFYSVAKMLMNAKQGNSREALLDFGKASTAIQISAVTGILINNGLVGDSGYTNKKVEALKAGATPSGKVNISGIKRLIMGENTSYRNDDLTIDTAMLGPVGASIIMQELRQDKGGVISGVYGDAKKIYEDKSLDSVAGAFESQITDLFGVGNFAMDQTFMAGATSLLEAVANSDTSAGQSKIDNVILNNIKLLTGIALPNNLAVLGRVNDKYKRNLKGDTLGESVSNVIKSRIFQTEDLPIQIGLFGEKKLNTPEGENPLVYHMLNGFGFDKIKTDKTYQSIDTIYQKTGDMSVIPSMVTNKLKVDGENIVLNKKQHSEYLEAVGVSRKMIVDDFINSDVFKKLDTGTKTDIFKRLYDEGLEGAKAYYFNKPHTEKNILKIWEYANDNKSTTPEELGAYYHKLGEDTNQNFVATKNQQKDFYKKKILLSGYTPDEVSEFVDRKIDEGFSKDKIIGSLEAMYRDEVIPYNQYQYGLLNIPSNLK